MFHGNYFDYAKFDSSIVAEYTETMNKRKLGLWLILTPIILIFSALILFAVVNTIGMSGVFAGNPLLLRIINFVLGGFGVIGALGLLIAAPIGVYYYSRSKDAKATLEDKFKTFQFKSLQRKTDIIKYLSIFLIASALITIWLEWQEMNSAALGGVLDIIFIFMFSVAAPAVAVISFIIFLTWVYRAYANLGPLSETTPANSPARAIWHYFIPIVSLIYPYRNMEEIRKLSAPKLSKFYVEGWWALFIVLVVLDRVVAKTIDVGWGEAEVPMQSNTYYFASIAYNVLKVGYYLVLIKMTKEISDAQEVLGKGRTRK